MSATRPVDPSIYAWEQSDISPSTWRRRALAGECMWISRPKDYHEIFLGGVLTLPAPASLEALSSAARSAWRRLRFENPEIVASAEYVGQDACMLCSVLGNGHEGDEWVAGTLRLGSSSRALGSAALREKLRVRKVGMDAGSCFLLLNGVVNDVEQEADGFGKVELMLNMDHQVTDGIGIRILLGRYLSMLTEALGKLQSLLVQEQLHWRNSAENLSGPWVAVMNDAQEVCGTGYEKLVESNRDFMFTKLSNNHGLPLLQTPKPSVQKTYSLAFTIEQSTQLRQKVKLLVDANSNITHLGHAAMVLALLRSNPLPSGSTSHLYSPCWLNGRRYLKPPHDTSHIPSCLSFAPIVFSDLQKLTPREDATKSSTKQVLLEACGMATKEYSKIKERKSMLPPSLNIMEDIGKKMWLNKKHPVAEEPTKLTAEPFFLSDGITERYISHTYHYPDSSVAFEVDDVTFVAHAEKNLIVRMSSWRGRTTLSAEWIECDHDSNMVTQVLKDMVEMMLSIIDE